MEARLVWIPAFAGMTFPLRDDMPSHAMLQKKIPGNALLSHGETPHYHRRNLVSLLSSEWNQVVPRCYGRQENRS